MKKEEPILIQFRKFGSHYSRNLSQRFSANDLSRPLNKMWDIMGLIITPQELAALLSGAFLVPCRASTCLELFVISPSWTIIGPPFPCTFSGICKEICFITQEIISLHKLLVSHMCSKPRKEQWYCWCLLSREKSCKLRKSLSREMLLFLKCE